MNKKRMFMVMLLVCALILAMSCQKNSETTEEGAADVQKNLVQYMDVYHRVLRPLMHQALPDKDIAVFKENAAELLKCAEKLAKAELPSKLDPQKEEVSKLVNELLSKTKSFYESCQSGTEDEIFDNFMAAHDEYEALADIVYKL